MSKKIAVVGIRGLPANYGGLETCAEEVCRRWVRQGREVMVYCRKNRYSDLIPSIDGVRLRYVASIPSKSLDTISHTFFSILDLIFRRRDYKHVHLYNTGNAIFIPLLKLAGKHVVLSGDGIEWKREKWGVLARNVHRLGEIIAAKLADHIVVDNDEVGAYYRERHDADTVMIPYGAKEPEKNPELTSSLLEQYGLEEKKYFLFVGRIVPEKGVHDLIDAYRKIDTSFPLVIIGDDDNGTAYRDQVFAQASESVRFLGFLYNDDYEQLLRNAYMYLSASRLEGTSPSLLAAMAAGVCCLVNGIRENVATVKGAVPTYCENDLDDLAARWQQLVDDPREASNVAARGLECVRRFYSWDAVADDYLALFDTPRGLLGHRTEVR